MRCLVLACSLHAACLTDENLESSTSSELGIGPTALTFYQHASLTGATYTVSLSERVRLVARADVNRARRSGHLDHG